MRRAMVVILILALLLALDIIFNGSRFSAALTREIAEFGRLINRTVDEMF